MKTLKFYAFFLSLLFFLPAFAQVQIDKPVQLTGTGADANITGIQTVTANSDATNKIYVDTAIANRSHWSKNGLDIYNNNSGNVGIGQTVPLSKLDVNGSAGTAISTTAISSATLLDASMSTVLATPASAYTITLPTLLTSVRRIYTIVYNGVPGTNTLSIFGNGANIIYGGIASATYPLTGGSVVLQNNGTAWYVTATSPCSAVPGTPGAISGPSSVNCSSSGNVYSVTAVNNAAYYNWALPSGSVITAGAGTNSITTTVGANSGNVSVSAANGCGASSSGSPLFVSVGGALLLDASNLLAQTNNAASNTFTINTSTANEVILIYVAGYSGGGSPFNGSVAVTGAGTVTQVATVLNAGGTPSVMALYACVPTATGSHTVTVTWGSNIVNSGYLMAYAASIKGFCSAPTVAANVQSATGYGTANASATVTPAVPSGILLSGFFAISGSGTPGVISWTNASGIRTDHGNNGCDASIASATISSTSPVTVTASSSMNGWTAPIMILAAVHP